MAKMQTKSAIDRFLAKVEDSMATSTFGKLRRNLNRLAAESLELPISKDALLAAIGKSPEVGVGLQTQRYDHYNRFCKDLAEGHPDIPNPCDEVRRPGRNVGIPTGELVEEFLEYKRREGLSVHTLRNYRDRLGYLVIAAPGLPATAEKVIEAIGDPADFKNNTRRVHYSIIGGFLNWAQERHAGLADVLAQVPVPKREKTIKRIFTAEELFRLVDAARNLMDRVMIIFLIDSGCRIGELVGMTLAHIRDGRVEVSGKSGPRIVPISPEMEWLLRSIAGPDGQIWWTERGAMTQKQIEYRYRRTAKAACIEGERTGPHTVRHTFATSWLRKKGGDMLLQRQLGHADLKTTQEYAQLVDDDVSEAHDRVSPATTLGLFSRDDILRYSEQNGGGVPDAPRPRRRPQGPLSHDEVAATVAREVRRLHDSGLEERFAGLAQVACEERTGGRPCVELPAPVARMILDDHDAGHTTTAIWRKYSPYCAFSRAWLTAALKDGRLERMAKTAAGTPSGTPKVADAAVDAKDADRGEDGGAPVVETPTATVSETVVVETPGDQIEVTCVEPVPEGVSLDLYCTRCKGRTDTLEAEVVYRKHRRAVRGECADCGTGKFQFIQSASVDASAGASYSLGNDQPQEVAMEIFCVKCKAKTETRDLVEVTMKNGKPAGQGICVDCGTRKFRIGKLPAGAT